MLKLNIGAADESLSTWPGAEMSLHSSCWSKQVGHERFLEFESTTTSCAFGACRSTEFVIETLCARLGTALSEQVKVKTSQEFLSQVENRLVGNHKLSMSTNRLATS